MDYLGSLSLTLAVCMFLVLCWFKFYFSISKKNIFKSVYVNDPLIAKYFSSVSYKVLQADIIYVRLIMNLSVSG